MPDITATVAGPAAISVSQSGPVAAAVVLGTPVGTGGVNAHASTHASGGPDPVSPSSIGALSAGEGIAYAIALG